MTSNISSRKLMFAEIRQRSYLPIIHVITFLLALPIAYLMRMNQIVNVPTDAATDLATEVGKMRVTETLSHLGGNGLVAFLLVFAALAGAMGSFDYLCAKQKVDFYHSIAMKREGLFGVEYLAGWLSGVVPYLGNLLITFFIAIGYGCVTRETLPVIGAALLWHLLFFTAVYGIAVLAMTLTGRRLIGVLLFIFLVFYGQACVAVLQGMKEISFSTYVDPPGIQVLLLRTSPITLVGAGFADAAARLDVIDWICMAGFAGLSTAIAFVIYRKRPSETAGNTYVHPIMNAVIKVATAIPGALAFGFLFSLFGVLGGRGWFVLGALLGAVLIGGVVELIQSVDIRGLWKHWRSGVLILVGVGAILAIFLLDPFGYDRYLPRRDRVQAMALYSDEMFKEVAMTNGEFFNEYDMKNKTTAQCDAIYALASEGVARAESREDVMNMWSDAAFYMGEQSENDPEPYEEQLVEARVLYRVGGVDRYRAYKVPRRVLEEAVDAMTTDEAYRETLYDVAELRAKSCDRFIFDDWNDLAGEWAIERRLSDAASQELTAALANDMARQGTGALRTADPVGTIGLYVDDEDGYTILAEYYVYENYDETIAFLEKMRYRLREAVDAEKIAAETEYMTVGWGGKRYEVRSREEILRILSNISRTRYESVERDADACSLEFYTGGDSYYIPCRWHDKEAAETLLAGKEIPEDDEKTDW